MTFKYSNYPRIIPKNLTPLKFYTCSVITIPTRDVHDSRDVQQDNSLLMYYHSLELFTNSYCVVLSVLAIQFPPPHALVQSKHDTRHRQPIKTRITSPTANQNTIHVTDSQSKHALRHRQPIKTRITSPAANEKATLNRRQWLA